MFRIQQSMRSSLSCSIFPHLALSSSTRSFATVTTPTPTSKLRMIILGAPVSLLLSSSCGSELIVVLVEVTAQGAGKGTQSDWLLEKWDIDTIVVGQLLRNEIVKGSQLGKFAEKKMKAGGEFQALYLYSEAGSGWS